MPCLLPSFRILVIRRDRDSRPDSRGLSNHTDCFLSISLHCLIEKASKSDFPLDVGSLTVKHNFIAGLEREPLRSYKGNGRVIFRLHVWKESH